MHLPYVPTIGRPRDNALILEMNSLYGLLVLTYNLTNSKVRF